MNELDQQPAWSRCGQWLVSSELFLDLIFTELCGCSCPWCIARTPNYAKQDLPAWEEALTYAMEHFPVRSLIILGGEATMDPDFHRKLSFTESVLREHPVEHLILTTNGIRLTEPDFLASILNSGIDAVNLSRMHWDQRVNDRIFGAATPTLSQIGEIYSALHARGKTLRVNVNVWRGNLDTVRELRKMIEVCAGRCDAVKLTPLMRTEMFGTTPEVTACAAALALPETEIRALFDSFCDRTVVLRRNKNVLGFVEYAELDAAGQRVLLKYAQLEDRYDRASRIPTLKLYPNGCLSNEWSFRRDVRQKKPAMPIDE